MENASASASSVALAPARVPRAASSGWIGLLALIVAALACALWWSSHVRLQAVERELARRIQAIDSSGAESHLLAKQASDQVVALQTRVGVLESKLNESQSQQASLEQLYQDLARTRDDWALAEVEQILSVASQQLQLAGNVQGALIALQNADARLARADRPQFIPLRRIIQRDMDRLRALPAVDLAGNALRLDSLAGMVDNLPLLSDERPVAAPRLDAQPLDRGGRIITAKDGSQKTMQPGWLERMQDAWRYGTAEVWDEVQQLVRIREVNQPEALLLTPSQSYFLRENLKLRLLNARLALLARQEPIFRADLLRAQEMLQGYFDPQARQTAVALSLLKQIEASNTVIELPTLSESLAAVRNIKSSSEH